MTALLRISGDFFYESLEITEGDGATTEEAASVSGWTEREAHA